MTPSSSPLWTIAELASQAALALAENYDGQANGSVRAVPDLRTIRYYTTLGLLDRPAELRGRTALYGRRHLLQLVAIKRLQARGLTLAELQERLLGQDDAALAKIAALPAGTAAAPPSPRSQQFWRERPTPVAPPEEQPAAPPPTLQGVPLAEGVTLLLAAARSLDDEDIAALRVAAAPLLRWLEKRRIITSNSERNPS